MYSAIVAEHANNPRCLGPLENATHYGVAGTPGEGHYFRVWLEVEGETIVRAAFQTFGCAAAIACGSLMCLVLTGRTLAQARRLEPHDIDTLAGGFPEGKSHCPHLAIEGLRSAFQEQIP